MTSTKKPIVKEIKEGKEGKTVNDIVEQIPIPVPVITNKKAFHLFSNIVVMRSIIALLYLFIFTAIVISLIVNPKSLNLEKNPIISIMIGALITFNKEVISYFFPNPHRES